MDRNLIMAIVLSAAVLFGYEVLIGAPQREAIEAARKAQAEQAGQQVDPSGKLTKEAGFDTAPSFLNLDTALADSPGRVTIDTPRLSGSINLRGGRFDDLELRDYRETLEGDSGNIQLLKPQRTQDGHYIEQGWLSGTGNSSKEIWQVKSGDTLTPTTPVTLIRSKDGLTFEKTISVDENYMFSIEQKVTNTTTEDTSLIPYALVIQQGLPEALRGGAILHEGAVGVVGKKLYDTKYKKLSEGKTVEASGTGGWVGITNKYWLAAAIPPQDQSFNVTYVNDGKQKGKEIFRTSYLLSAIAIPAGGTAKVSSRVFGGAKEVKTLQAYEVNTADGRLGVVDFDKAVDWGWLNFLTRPIFFVLEFFGSLVGNYGVAILLLTLCIKALLFPLANKGYESMTKMKKLQPQLEKLRTRHEDDKMKLQQEMMGLYKKEGVNPMAGCLPILIQMPIFFALYKTLFVTLELRHEPFFGWIKDLSAPDPTNLFNLFGLIPFDPTSLPLIGTFLGIGVLPILMGAAMWFQMSLNPPPPDPVQRQIFAFLPLIFVFLFAGFSAGLVVYWIWNTVLSVAQQLVIMKKNGVTVEWRERFSFLFPKNKTVTLGGGATDSDLDSVIKTPKDK